MSSQSTRGVERSGEPHPAGGALPPPDGAEEPISILLVDDEPKNLAVLESVLNQPNYRLVRAESADKALMALIAEEFAVLVLDIQMPDMNGFELAQMIKQRKRTASLPIIFLTAYYSEESHVVEGYSTGAVDYLHKPINPTILRSKVAVFAELYRKTRECSLANRALSTEVDERRRTQEQLALLAQELEQRVLQRTSELMKANADLKQAEAALREADRRKDEFLATLAHELRNPLAPIRNAVQILQLKECGPDDWHSAADVVDRQSRQLTHLVDDLLDISRITRGKLALRMRPVKVRDAMLAAVETSGPLIESCGHHLTLELPAEDLTLNGDLTRLSQILSNLLNNAAKFTDRDGEILLAARRDGANVLISVKDNGVGIAPEMMPYVFQMFAQVDRHQDRSQGGLGIGLQLVKSLVEMHGGSISAASAGAGSGSEFVVCLPLLVDSTADAAEVNARPTMTAGPRLKVLVVDDKPDNVESLRLLLTLMGHTVQTAADGAEGIRAAEEFRPDVILLDIGMPDLDGHEVCRRIRAEEWGRSIVIIAQTGWGQEDDRRRTNAAGFDYHLVKPINHAELNSRLAQVSATRENRNGHGTSAGGSGGLSASGSRSERELLKTLADEPPVPPEA
jgi:signal transduction histidine kinase